MVGVEQVGAWIRRRRAVRHRLNPYVVGTPVLDQKLFFGRQALTSQTLERLELGSVSVIGERRIGKTSFLHHLRCSLAGRLDDNRRTVPVFVDLESSPGAGLLETLLEETLDLLTAGCAKRGASLCALGRSGAAAGLGLCEGLLDEIGGRRGLTVRLVYLIDEIDVLADEVNLAETLAALSEGVGAQVRFVIAGARRRASAPRPGHGRGMFEEVDLRPLSAEDAAALVRRPVEGLFDFETAAIESILDRSRLRPHLIQRLCARAVDRMLDDGRSVVRRSDVDTVSTTHAERS